MRMDALIPRLGLLLAGSLTALLLAEVSLRMAGLPRFHEPHPLVPQFRVTDLSDGDLPVYINVPDTSINFTYDSNQRGYFGAGNVIEHRTNSAGFRGGEFAIGKKPGTLRIAFFGDSFTFGEGVRFEDTYPEVVARELGSQSGASRAVESYNFGVGGYNTRQALDALRRWGMQVAPDIVVLGFVLNDAEEPLVVRDPASGQAMRRNREIESAESMSEPRPPQKLIYRLRLAQLGWQFVRNNEQTSRTIDYYRSLYAGEHPAWRESRAALQEIAGICRENDIPLYVIDLPILIELRDYPFRREQEMVRQVVESAGGRFVDLLPQMREHPAAALWVHPYDQHPHEVAHHIAGHALARAMSEDGTLP
jgi:hypothetical protein